MAVEKCEHKYYKIEDGKLVCSECGAGPEAQKIQDKEKKPDENKQGVHIPPVSKRIK